MFRKKGSILSSVSLKRVAPELDLRTVMIRRPRAGAAPPIVEAVASRHGDAEPADIFFHKGNATAEGFRPAYWTYEVADADEARAASRHALDKIDDLRDELVVMERAFIDTQRRLLDMPFAHEDEDEGEGEGEGEETPVREPHGSLVAEGDLRSIVIRPRAHADFAASDAIEELFAKKSAMDERPASSAALSAPPPAPPRDELRRATERAREPVRAPKAARAEGHPGLRLFALACACGAAFVMLAARSSHLAPGAIPVAHVAPASVAAPSPAPAAPVVAAPPPAPSVAAPPPPAPSVAAPPPAAAAPAPSSDAAGLIAQGNGYLANGDIMSARLCFERAADDGSGRAALLAGMTFDPRVLESAGVYGFKGDKNEAASWYRRAVKLGEPDAAKLLALTGAN